MSQAQASEDRQLRFEACRFAIDTFVKIHLEHIEGARLLLTSHLRMMFTLSLGALAGLITLYASILRFGSVDLHAPGGMVRVGFAMAALASMVVSALLSAASLQRASADAAQLLRDPFPDTDNALTNIFDKVDADERQILQSVNRALEARVARHPGFDANTRTPTVLLLVGVVMAGLSFFEAAI